MNAVLFTFALVVALLQFFATAQEAENKTYCDFSNINCKHAFETRVRILQMFERVWEQCPTMPALDRNIGYMERGYHVLMVIREHARGILWERKYITGKTREQQVKTLYDVYLNRQPTKDEKDEYVQLLRSGKDYRWPENDIVWSPEFYNRYWRYNVVPGCGRGGLNCTGMLDSITQSYCRLFHVCPQTFDYMEMGWMGGLGDIASPMMIHRHYMQSMQYELMFMKGHSTSEKVDKLYKHLLNRNRTPEDEDAKYEKLAATDYRMAVVAIQESSEYQEKWGKWTIPGNDPEGHDIVLQDLTFRPPCA